MNPMLLTDSYKLGHILQYPQGTEFVYANFTPRSNKHFEFAPGMKSDKMVFFGLQAVIEKMVRNWDEDFFSRPFKIVYQEFMESAKNFMGDSVFPKDKMRELHDHGCLPIRIKALPEGSLVNIRVPVFTIINTEPEFYWLTNYLETYLSAELWKLCTSATTAHAYRQILRHWSWATGANPEFMNYQAHDFSMRGMSGCEDAISSGAAHLTSFYGTDCIAAPSWIYDYYVQGTHELPFATSVPATEHSVMCIGQENGEKETIRRLIEDVYPTGIVSIVADSWDFWKVIGQYSHELKDLIMKRNGKVVFRPDSGDPVKIICGDRDAPVGSPEYKGAVQVLWDNFGGTTNNMGFRTLNNHVGLIYGDSITMERADEILRRLWKNGFTSDNIVFGVGSYTYQRVTRDTLGFAVKATWGVVNGKEVEIVKCPKTDSGMKNSAAGLLRVEKEGDDYVLYDRQTREQEQQGELKVVFEDGEFHNFQSFDEIRRKLMV